ncbi:adenylosuccinate lyase [Nocardioides mangrovicus]|uniref:Adenylosuccinate lyase n=1 Tax=Nocardioides mangrovicus TaxID=2478913 RepID=A0A3L8P0A0_9ACTN|nr:lyase family protein [Nocardioides mangrovicus]RLV48223.1 adenylosuccinate lyase [Nocardioides mangrovicus]
MSLLTPGWQRSGGLVDDAALVAAMVRVEAAWLQVTAGLELPEVAGLDLDADPTGNPVTPLVAALRAAASDDVAPLIHRGLTSQDVLDTALQLLTRDALVAITDSLDAAVGSLADLARTHRDAVMAGRTLTQYAVPVTFGLVAAQWLVGLLDARDGVRAVRRVVPVQCGGAAGTLSLADTVLEADPVATAADFADELGLAWPGLPWHTRRTPVTRAGDAVVEALDAAGVIAADVLLLGRAENGEVREGARDGAGGSSTMPHKQNPVLATVVRSASMQAPQLGATLHLAAGNAVDQRPDGAWHAEWPTLQRLLGLGIVATSQVAELTAGLQVDVDLMRRRAEENAEALLAESRGVTDVDHYLGAAGAFVDEALARAAGRDRADG